MSSLEKFAEKLSEQQLKKQYLFVMVSILIILSAMPGLPLLLNHIEPSLEKILPQEVEEIQTMNEMRMQYGADMMFLVFSVDSPAMDVRDPDVLKYLSRVTQKLSTNDYILEATSSADLVKQINNNVIPESNKKIRELLAQHPETPRYINHDYSDTLVIIRSDTGATASVIKETVDEIYVTLDSLEATNPGLSYKLTGFNAIDKATFEVIIKDFGTITLISFLFMLAFLALYFRSIKKVVSSVSVIIISLIITAGITGYLGLTITVITMVAAAMIMALGISYGINVTYDYYRLREENNKEDSLRILNKNLIRALIGSSFTTSAGFLALLFGIIPAMKNLGIVLAMGIVVTLIVSIFLLPIIIYKSDKVSKVKNKSKKVKARKQQSRQKKAKVNRK